MTLDKQWVFDYIDRPEWQPETPRAIIQGEADAGATGTIMWTKAPADERKVLHEIFQSDPAPGLLALAHQRLGETIIKQLRSAFIDFSAADLTDPLIISRRGLVEFLPLNDVTLQELDPFIKAIEYQ